VLYCLNHVETVLLCSDNEGRARVLQEAIAAGKGVVAYDNPGSREVVNEWSTQWPYTRLIPIGDRLAASQAILDLAADILHQCQKLGFLTIAKAETLDFSLRTPGSQVLLRMVQDMRLATFAQTHNPCHRHNCPSLLKSFITMSQCSKA